MIPTAWANVESSTIGKIKFVPNPHDLRGDLHVEFRTGKTYRFKDVPTHKVEHLYHCSSPGEYFRMNIRGEHDSEPVK